MKHYYITYMVDNNLHSCIVNTDSPETFFTDATKQYTKKHGHPICILFVQETTAEDEKRWDENIDNNNKED